MTLLCFNAFYSFKSTMTNTLATLSSTSFRQETLLPETTMATQTPLLKFIFFQGEGKCRTNFNLNFLLVKVCYVALINRTKSNCYRKSRFNTSKNDGFLIQSQILFPGEGEYTYFANDLRKFMIIPVGICLWLFLCCLLKIKIHVKIFKITTVSVKMY